MTSSASSFASRVVTYELPFWGMAALNLRSALGSLTGSTAVLVEGRGPDGDVLSAAIRVVGDAVPSLELRVVAAPRVLQSICAHLGGHVAADIEALETILLELATKVAEVIERAAADQGVRYTLGAASVSSASSSSGLEAGDVPVTMTYAFDPAGAGVLVEARELRPIG